MRLRCSEYRPVVAFSFVVVCLMSMLFRIDDEYGLLILMLALLLMSLRKQNTMSWNVTDLALLVVTVLDVMSCLYGINTTQSIRHAAFSVFCFGSYLLLRHIIMPWGMEGRKDLKILLFLFFSAVIVALLLSIVSFFVFRSSVFAAGFDDIYHFRALYRPLGYICNGWAEIGIVLFGLSLLHRKFMMPVGFVSAFAVLLTFSRGAYVAMALFAVYFMLSVRNNGLRLRFLGILASALVVVAVLCPQELHTVVSGNVTQSQRQSTEWRINSTKQVVNVIKEAPLIGHGNGNYSMATDKSCVYDNTGLFTTLAPNVIIFLMVEKGIIGMSLWGVIVLMSFVRLFKHRSNYGYAVVGCTFIALFVKEMTQATLFSNPFVLFLCYCVLAFMNSCDSGRTFSCKYTLRVASMCVMTVWFVGLSVIYIDKHDTEIISESFEMLRKGDFSLASNLVMTTYGNVPSKIEQGVLLTRCYLNTKDERYARKAETIFLDVRSMQKEDLQPCLFLAFIYLRQGKPKKTLDILKIPIAMHPENGIYQYYMAEAYRQMKMDRRAADCLTDAVMAVPRLLNTESVKKIKTCSPDIYYWMFVNIVRKGETLMTPKEWARYGYILDVFGQKDKSAEYLRKAVIALPNLSTPWRLLGENQKYSLLGRGAFQNDKSKDRTLQDENLMLTDFDVLKMGYDMRYSSWYGREFMI